MTCHEFPQELEGMWAVKQRIAIVMLPKPVKTEVDEKRLGCCGCDRAGRR